jgi:DNA-directed RNA polymerase I, II, and III subunit RPABC1
MDINNTYKVYKTIIEMLIDRGYKVSRKIEYDEFFIMYEESNYDIIDDEGKIYVEFFKDTKSFGKKDLENIVQNLKDKYGEEIKIIIILKEKINVTIEKELVNPLYKNVEIFLFKNLIFNITKHNEVPKHIPMSKDEIKELLDKYRLSKTQIPKILSSDPMVKYYGLKPGDMFKIIRSSLSAGEYITYRYVR